MKNPLHTILQTRIDTFRLGAALLAYRLLLSASLFHTHGLPKVTDFEAEIAHIPDPFSFGQLPSALLAVFSNIVCPVFVAAGLFTRLAVLPILIVTLTGFFIVHGDDPARVRDVPFMYSLAFGLLLVLGAGKFSVDNRLAKNW